MKPGRLLHSIVIFLLLGQAPGALAGGTAVRVYGSAGEVSGSLSIVDLGPTQLMVDCGAYYPHGEGTAEDREERAARKNNSIPESASQCQYLVWTHAHLDHIGRTPLLVRQGFRGAILTTEGTAAIAPVMLEMQVRYDAGWIRNWSWTTSPFRKNYKRVVIKPHWHPNCKYARKISRRNLASRSCSLEELEEFLGRSNKREVAVAPCKMCASLEVGEVMALVRTYPYDEDVRVGNHTRLRFLYAGHIPGSASILIESGRGGASERIMFSGDLGNEMSLLAPGPAPSPPADLVFVETTYGNHRRDPMTYDQHEEFRADIAKTLEGGGVAWIPAFALDRTQKILYELTFAQDEGQISRRIPIYCPSPSGAKITELYQSHQSDGWFFDDIGRNRDAFRPSGFSKMLPDGYLHGPAIVISTSGMMDAAFAGRIAPVLRDPRTTVFLVGYQDPNTPGGELKSGVRRVEIDGQEYSVAAEVKEYGCFSGHGDAADIDGWLANQKPGATVVLVHGEGVGLHDRADGLSSRFNVIVAKPGAAIEVN